MKKEMLYQILIVAVSLVVTILFSLSFSGRIINLKLYDLYSMIKPRPSEWNKILYVNIDDQSIDIVGRWPWPRNVIAEGVDVLKEFGAEKILFDIEFIEQSPDTLNYDFYNQFKEQGNKNISFSRLQPEMILQPDKILLKAMTEGEQDVYLACRGVDDTKKTRTDISQDEFKELDIIYNKYFLPLTDIKLTNSLPVDRFMETPAFPLYLGAKGLGFTTADKDIDGSVRKIVLFRIHNNYLVPQLVLPIIMDEMKIIKDKIEIKPGSYIRFVTEDKKTITIPVNKRGEMFINWTKRWRDHPFSEKGLHIPFSALIEYKNNKKMLEENLGYLKLGDLTPEDKQAILENIQTLKDNIKQLSEKISAVKGKIVITGNTSSSSTDIGSITIDPTAPMALIHANIINTIYKGAFLTQLPETINIIITSLIILLIFLFSINVNSATKETVITAIMIPSVLILLYVMLAAFGMILNYIMIIFGTIATLIAITVFKFILFDKQKNFIKRAFMQYLSPEVVKQVIANPALLKLGGERREITAFFSDVQGFTTISEKLTPEEVVKLLNKYLTAMTDIILKYGGTVDKYEGDAIVAFFGAPIPHEDHAVRCCNAAVDMQESLVKLREQWVSEGYPEVIARIGINTGPAIIGNMGSEQRMDYTMMGDTVNTAARFEGANKPYGTFVMISEVTYEQIRDKFVVRKLDLLKVVGKTKPIAVYELVGRIGEVNEERMSILSRYHEALDVYYKKDWNKAFGMFQELVKRYNDPPSRTYMERCAGFKEAPPKDDWNGVFTLTSK